ncbi:MAG: RNA polymerase sigma factor [Flavobacteriales bacterium]|nr:RNA polymerase sigma factor [Flavobacteriales bacterium]MCC6330347.1 RNA polymerase sigma factor [Ignavibacteria bacterium]MCL4278003.1 RNA polymerase sigma factor [Ignavibacteria bacterium]QOJ26614.1 MAG: RNA polymerase sigma factor [Ignavibacteria bacterium]
MMRQFSEYTDVELFRLLASGQSEDAFGELYARYSGTVYSYCIRLMGDREKAHDIFQDTFMHFLQSARRHQQLDNVKGYLLTITRNLCFNEKKRASSQNLEFDEELYNPGFSREADYNEMMQLIAMALELLPDDMREAFVLREYQGLTYQEISGLLTIKLETAKVRVFRARQRIKEILQPYLDEFQHD